MASRTAKRRRGVTFLPRPQLSCVLRVGGLLSSWLIGLGCLASAIYLLKDEKGSILLLRHRKLSLLPVAINVVIHLFNKGLGSLNDGSSVRSSVVDPSIFHQASPSLLNITPSSSRQWQSNGFVTCCLVGAYASAPLVLLADPLRFPEIRVCALGLAILGVCLLGQVLVASWFVKSTLDPTPWSQDSSGNAAIVITPPSPQAVSGQHVEFAHYIPSSTTSLPRHRQRLVPLPQPEVRKALYLLMLAVALGCTWAAVIITFLADDIANDTARANYLGYFPHSPHRLYHAALTWDPKTLSVSYKNDGLRIDTISLIWTFVLLCGLQAVLTVFFHSAESLVTRSRKGAMWRRASGKDDVNSDLNGLVYALSTCLSWILFLFRPILHWLFGLSMSTAYSVGATMSASQVFYLIGAVGLLSLFTGFIMVQRPTEHLQFVVDFVDPPPTKE